MVYNAMKLFMEINPQLFDDCSHDYTELQNTADQRQQARQDKWDRLAEQARRKKESQLGAIPLSHNPKGPKVNAPMRIDEADPMTQDSQRKLDALRIQDESSSGRDQRRPREPDTQNLVSPDYARLAPILVSQELLTSLSVSPILRRRPDSLRPTPSRAKLIHRRRRRNTPSNVPPKLEPQRPSSRMTKKYYNMRGRGLWVVNTVPSSPSFQRNILHFWVRRRCNRW